MVVVVNGQVTTMKTAVFDRREASSIAGKLLEYTLCGHAKTALKMLLIFSGISFALLFMFIFAIFTSAMLLFGANFTNLICDPWKHPSERPDVVSFVDRFFFHDFLAKIGGGETTNDLTLSKIITQCNAGKSFYTIFGMDKKLQLSNGFSDDLEAFLDSMHLPSDFVINISEELRDVSLAASDSVVKSTQAFESFGFAPVEGTSEVTFINPSIKKYRTQVTLNV
jgi:hypothetical protein